MLNQLSDSNETDNAIDATESFDVTQASSLSNQSKDPIKFSFDYDVIVALDLYINCVVIQILCALAIGGNLINIVVISHHGFQETTNIVMTSLAVCDLVFSLTNCLYTLRAVIGRFDTFLSSTFLSYYMVYVFPWNQWSLSCSIGHVTIIAVERMVAVCFPFRVSRIVTVRRMASAVVSVYVCNVLMSVPLHLIFEVHWVVVNQSTTWHAVLLSTQFYKDNFELINFFLSAVFNNLVLTLPLIIVFVCTSTIIVKISVNRRNIKMSLTASSNRREKRAVKSLLTVCVVFLVVVAPTSVLNVYINIGPESSVLSIEFRILVAFLQGLLYQTSATVNFFIYLMTSSKFAGTYKALFCFRL